MPSARFKMNPDSPTVCRDDECVCANPNPATGECNVECPAIGILCPPGAVPGDLDGDGCDDGCICEDGTIPSAGGGCGPNECVALDPYAYGLCEMLLGVAEILDEIRSEMLHS